MLCCSSYDDPHTKKRGVNTAPHIDIPSHSSTTSLKNNHIDHLNYTSNHHQQKQKQKQHKMPHSGTCPKCGTSMQSENKTCTSCGAVFPPSYPYRKLYFSDLIMNTYRLALFKPRNNRMIRGKKGKD